MALKRSTEGPGPTNKAVAKLAERQHGVVSRGQLRGLGIADARIRGQLSRRILWPVHRGVYAVGRKGLASEGRWMAAVLACGDDAVLSHRSAGRLWRLLRRSSGPMEVTRGTGWRAPASVVVRRVPVPDDERAIVEGIPVTGVSRTLLDLAAVLSKRQLERALNEAEVLRLTDSLSLPALLDRYPRRHGTAMLRAILADAAMPTGIIRNDFEEAFAALIDAHELPRPRFNADLFARGRHFNVDCLWSDRRLIVELDGGAVHRTARAFESDRERDRILGTAGWQVVRVTWRQLQHDSGVVVDDLRDLLRRRST